MYLEAGIFLAIKLPFLKAKENFSDKAWEGLLDVRLGLGLISISKHRLGHQVMGMSCWYIPPRTISNTSVWVEGDDEELEDNGDEDLEIKD